MLSEKTGTKRHMTPFRTVKTRLNNIEQEIDINLTRMKKTEIDN